MSAILLTQCLQHDFVRPLERFEALPNRLHIGFSESLRLMGERPSQGPVSRVMTWAYERPVEELAIIHLRDWHDRSDPSQREHLERFGEHCLKDTPGADFVFFNGEDRGAVHVVDSLTLNDFQNTGLETLLAPFQDRPTRIGLTGVWTEAKVYFLAYELVTRYPHFQVAVCSALTASSSRIRHFEALEQMERILGVRVIHSVGEFVDFLGGEELETPLLGLHERFPEIQTTATLTQTDRTLLRYLFRDCKRVQARVLDGGFSGNMVLGTESVDIHGHQQVPHVVKIGPQEAMGKERASFEKIQNVLGNNAPQISEFADFDDRGGIKYRYASMGGSFTTTLQKLVERGDTLSEVSDVLHAVFGEQLYRLYQARTLEQTNLLEHYQFASRWAPGVRKRMSSVLGRSFGDEESLKVVEGWNAPNLALFYEKELDKIEYIGRCFQAYVHGDLNGANIIIDGHQNVWLIDFFHTRRAHVLMDLIKLENDLLFIFTKLQSEQDVKEFLPLLDKLLEVEDLAAPLPRIELVDRRFRLTWEIVRVLRSFYRNLIESDRSPYQHWVGALRYAAHTLGFDECNPWQKKAALYYSGHLSHRIVLQSRANRRLRVDWITHELGLTILPGRADRLRDLAEDLEALRQQGVDSIVCMVPDVELAAYGVPDLLESYRKKGFDLYHLPVVDQRVCSMAELRAGVSWVQGRIGEGKKVLAHCVGGLGRSGFLVAAYLMEQGLDVQSALDEVRSKRSRRAIETTVQEELLQQFAQELEKI